MKKIPTRSVKFLGDTAELSYVLSRKHDGRAERRERDAKIKQQRQARAEGKFR